MARHLSHLCRYYFMDSPGNDLESIAGQVASGCNAIFFVTGNGSVTNFPFVPTLKIITTSARHALLSRDMDFNAGRFQVHDMPWRGMTCHACHDMIHDTWHAMTWTSMPAASKYMTWHDVVCHVMVYDI